MKVHCISGSLRAASSNSSILRVFAALAPADVTVTIESALDQLPYFNPDLDRALHDPALPVSVRQLRERVGAAEALVISSPEYAHGVPGMLKNALDWLVGGEEMPGKPVALFNTSPHASHAQASLAETLRTMSCVLAEGANLTIALPRGATDEVLVRDPVLGAAVHDALAALRSATSA